MCKRRVALSGAAVEKCGTSNVTWRMFTEVFYQSIPGKIQFLISSKKCSATSAGTASSAQRPAVVASVIPPMLSPRASGRP